MEQKEAEVDILLDMDGVVVDWATPVCKLFGKDLEELKKTWPRGRFDIENVLEGVGSDLLWEKINEKGEDFWANMEEMPWARRLYNECAKRGNVYFLTAPNNKPSCLGGKLRWIQRFTGDEWFPNFLIGKPKFLCSKPGQILIDDADKNIKAFRNVRGASGHGILLPQVWNSNHDVEGDPIDYVLGELDGYIELHTGRCCGKGCK